MINGGTQRGIRNSRDTRSCCKIAALSEAEQTDQNKTKYFRLRQEKVRQLREQIDERRKRTLNELREALREPEDLRQKDKKL